MNASPLHIAFHKTEAEWNRRREPRVFDPGQGREFFTKRTIKILSALFVKAAEARVDLQQKRRVGMQSRIDRSRFRSATNEKRGGGNQREGKCNLRDDERIARQKFPARPVGIFAGLLFQISDHGKPREFQRRTEGETNRSENAEEKCGAEDRRIRTAQPNEIERKHRAK